MEPRVTSVFLFPNGMVAVCDQHGQQMPQFQGKKEEVEERIGQLHPHLKFLFAKGEPFEWRMEGGISA